jgi:hypothetical protein
MRVVAGVGAWLLGVGAATAGSLLAVSLLGQGIAANTSQQLTSAAVSNALAAEATETQAADPVTADSPSPVPSATRSHQARPAQGLPEAEDTPSARPGRSRSASAPSAPATATGAATSTSTVLSSLGGAVVADCRPGGAYLVSWSPAPGYEVGSVVRGPAVTARVSFSSTVNAVAMLVSCSDGVPTASNLTGSSGTGSDDGGGSGGDD